MDHDNLIEQAHEGGLDISVEEKTIRAAFDLSFDNLQQKDQRVFLMLGVHPGRVVDREEIAAMTGSSVDGAGAQLERLCDASLLVEVGCHRYTLHDLVRRYVERKAAEMPTADRRQALTALAHHYATRSQQFAEEAGWSLLRYDTPGPRRPPAPLPEGRSQALTWFTSKRANLLDILGELDDGAVGECPHDAIRPAFVSLVAAMAGYLRNNGPWEVAERLHARAAELAPDPVAQAVAYNNLGITHRLLGQVNPSGDGSNAPSLRWPRRKESSPVRSSIRGGSAWVGRTPSTSAGSLPTSVDSWPSGPAIRLQPVSTTARRCDSFATLESSTTCRTTRT